MGLDWVVYPLKQRKNYNMDYRKELESAVNTYLEGPGFAKMMKDLKSSYVIDHNMLRDCISKIGVTFEKDSFYSDRLVKPEDIDLPLDQDGDFGKDGLYFKGLGNLSITVILTSSPIPLAKRVFARIVFENLERKVFRYFNINSHVTFFNIDVDLYQKGELIESIDLESYETYNFDDISLGRNSEWVEA